MNYQLKGYRKLTAMAIIGVAICLTSCETEHPTHQTSIQQSQSILRDSIKEDRKLDARLHNVPNAVNADLMPSLSHYINHSRTSPMRFDVSANKIPARDFFMGLVAGTQYNMVVNPSVSGTISLELKNVTIRQTLEAVKDVYGFNYRQTSYGFEISPPRMETRLYHLNYLDVQRTGNSYTQLTSGEITNTVGSTSVGNTSGNTNAPPVQAPVMTPEGNLQGAGTISSITTKTEIKFWQNIEKTIKNMLGKEEGHSVTVNALSGLISVRAFPNELHHVYTYINNMQSSLNRQVILEAKILEVQLNDEFQAGVDWSVLGNPAQVDASGNPIDSSAGMGQAANKVFPDTDLKTLTGIFAIKVNGNFKTMIQLLEEQGNVQILSSPHISTVNNQKAVIKVGEDEFFVTGVSTTNTIIGSNTLPSQNVVLTPFFSGITLDVTPEISSDNTVVLHIHPSVSKVTEQIKEIGLGSSATGTPNNLTLPLASSTIRESDNIVRAKNGQVIVIGGLMQNVMSETVVGTPWISKIPFIGGLFRRTEQSSTKSELIILLRPIVASNKSMIEQMKQADDRMQIYKRPFHASSLPKVFGNEAECDEID